MTKGHIGWHELHAGNLEEDWAFYSGLFGWVKDAAYDMGGEVGTYQTYGDGTGGYGFGGMMTKMAQTPMPHWVYYFSIGDIDAAAKRVTENGGTVMMGPHEVPGGTWIVNALDPQGAEFALIGNKV
jgi:predicted enzyme related to lactoylglutathione lyase